MDVGPSRNEKSSRDEIAVPTIEASDLDTDPHGIFRLWRPKLPFVISETGAYVVLRARDVEEMMRDPRLRATETAALRVRGITQGAIYDFFDLGILTANGPVHKRRRSPFTRPFAARLMEELRPRIRATAEALVDEWIDDGEVDLVDRYTSLIPARTLADLLGLPHEDIPRFSRLSYEVSRILSSNLTIQDFPQVEAAARELQEYVAGLLEQRRREPVDDFLSRYLADADEAGDLTPLEVVIQIMQMIIGGTDTTRIAGAIQVALLLAHPEQFEAVRQDSDLISSAVYEALRFEPIGGSVSRFSAEDIELDGHVIPAGKLVALSAISAMRDETVYERPDIFDIRRTDRPRLLPVFGGGAHRCIGEALARVELEEGLGVLVRRLPKLRLVEGMPKLSGHGGIRRIDPMRVAW